MDILKRKDIRQLIEAPGEWFISLYMPTHQTGREQQQDRVRFKNLIVQAQEQLSQNGVRNLDYQMLMRPADNLLIDSVFWQHQGNGLAMFLSPGFFRVFRLQSKFEELVVVAKNFHIKPLLSSLGMQREFYILALSLNSIHLFLSTRDTISKVELLGVPASMEEALLIDDHEKHIDFHTGTRNPGSGRHDRPAIFHGQGGLSNERNKKNILRYFQYVNHGLKTLLNNATAPMVLAGVNYLLPIYHEANTYPGLLKDGLEGNPEGLQTDELRKRAWNLVKPIFAANQKESIAQFENLYGKQSKLVTTDLATTVKAAKYGRVDTLFVPLGIQRWGHFELEENQVIVEDDRPNLENQDLTDLAAIQTISNSGQVYALHPKEIPGDGDLASILRYAT